MKNKKEKNNIILIRHSKCASSFLHRHFSNQSDILGTQSQFHPDVSDYEEMVAGPTCLTGYDLNYWRTVSSIRHPIERFFSALYFSNAMYVGRQHEPKWRKDEWFGLPIEVQLSRFLETGHLSNVIHELWTCAPGMYTRHEDLLHNVDLLFFQENMDAGLKEMKSKWGITFSEAVPTTTASSSEAYLDMFGSNCEGEKKMLRDKYYNDLEQIFLEDIEFYEALYSKNITDKP